MREVLQKAQELAEAIIDSEPYLNMKKAERVMRKDETASSILGTMIEKRQKVENILSSNDMNPEELKTAGEELEEAEKAMNENDKIIGLKQARKEFQNMMDNVNKILKLVVTGEVGDDTTGYSGCDGNCSGCSGCR